MDPHLRSQMGTEVHAMNTATNLVVEALMKRVETLVLDLPKQVCFKEG